MKRSLKKEENDDCEAQKKNKEEQQGGGEECLIYMLPDEIWSMILGKENMGIWNIYFICLAGRYFNSVIQAMGGKKYWLGDVKHKMPDTYGNPRKKKEVDLTVAVMEDNLYRVDGGVNLSFEYLILLNSGGRKETALWYIKSAQGRKRNYLWKYPHFQIYWACTGQTDYIATIGNEKVIDMAMRVALKYHQDEVIKLFGKELQEEERCLELIRICSEYERLDLIKWMKEQSDNSKLIVHLYKNYNISAIAAKKGNFRMLKWCRDNIVFNSDQCICAASFGGQIEMLKFLMSNYHFHQSQICECAAKGNQFETLKWLRNLGIEWDEHTCKHVAENGNFEMLKWCVNNGAPYDITATNSAVDAGIFEMLKWLVKDAQAEWGESTFTCAAENGRLEMLQWLADMSTTEELPFGVLDCALAARDGHFDTLKWCIQNGAPYSKEQIIHLCEYDETSSLFYGWDDGKDDDDKRNSQEIVQWLKKNA